MAVSGLSAAIQRAVAPVARRVRLVVGRGIVKLVNDATKAQTLQVALLAGELRSDVERWENYGFTSRPKPGAEALFLSVAGDRSHGAVVCVMDRTKRPAGVLAEGDVALWEETNGIRVRLVEADGTVELAGATDFVALAELVESEVGALRDTVNSLVTAYNGHIHITTATVGASPTPGILSPTASTATPPAAVGSVAAEKVKAE